MEDSRKERLMLVITTLAGIACFLQNFFGGWEFWMPPVIAVVAIILWGIHLTLSMDKHSRCYLYFSFSAFLCFYHGIHDTSLFEVSVAFILFMATYSMMDSAAIMNIVLAEYSVVMVIQFVLHHIIGDLVLDGFTVMKFIFHIGTVFAFYMLTRFNIAGRNSERVKLQKWRGSVKANDQDIEDFLSNISHELRTPVNVISGMTAILQKDGESDQLTAVKSACMRLSHQIEDIQDYTELKRGELVMDEENYMCISLVNDVVANFNAIDRSRDLELIVDLDPKTPAMLKGDIRKLHKLFRHLLENAVKFTRHGGIYIKLSAVTQEYGVNLIVEITDTGIGMTRADMSRVTKGMYQANKKRNRSTGGIGIGLPIVYGFVHQMGGFVKIESERKKGTTVHLSIPQKIVDPSPCLAVDKDSFGDIVFYLREEKYKIPRIREFYKAMAVNLARGLKVRLYSASDKKELDHLRADLNVTHIFTGQEEYEAEKEMLNYIASEGTVVTVNADPGYAPAPVNGVIVLTKPLYGFPVVRILNGEKLTEGAAIDISPKPYFNGVRALIVDDEPMNLVVAEGLFREYGMITDTAESGQQSIEKYENGDYDVIFMDHMMPEMDGVEAMKHLKFIADGSFRHPVFIALTANALSGAKEMFIKEGFDGFIAKPVDIGEFERVMKSVLPESMISYEGRAE